MGEPLALFRSQVLKAPIHGGRFTTANGPVNSMATMALAVCCRVANLWRDSHRRPEARGRVCCYSFKAFVEIKAWKLRTFSERCEARIYGVDWP